MKINRLALAAWLSAAVLVPVAWAGIYTDTLTATGTVALGGITYPASGTSGGFPAFSAATTLTSTGAIAANHAVTGGGVGAVPIDSLVTVTKPATGATLTLADGSTLVLGGAFSTTLTATATTVSTLPAGTHSLAPLDSPIFTSPTLGVATATSLAAPTINAGADASAGTISIFPTTTATGKTTLTASSNTGATTTNINTALQAGARTYTVPDQGGNATFQLTGGTQSATTGLIPTPLSMTGMRTAAGLMMTASASGTNFGLTYTPGTTAILIGTATSSSTTGDTAAIDIVLPPNYIAGTNITLTAGCYYTNTSSTASVHTMAAAAYLNTNAGLQGSTLIATGAQTCPITTSALQTFTITGATLVPGSLLTLTFTAAVTNGAGVSTEWLTAALIN